MNNYFASRNIPRNQSGKTRQKIDPATVGHVIKEVINSNLKLRIAASNFGISKNYKILLKFQE
jgi:hypothetical protein